MNEVQEVTREGLKIIALRERVAELTSDYEDKIANLRVDLTYALQRLADYESETTDVQEDPSASA